MCQRKIPQGWDIGVGMSSCVIDTSGCCTWRTQRPKCPASDPYNWHVN